MMICTLSLFYLICLLPFILGFILGLFLAKFNTTPPKPHSFIEKEQKSSVPMSVTTAVSLTSLMTFIYTSSGFLFLSGIFFNMSSELFSSIFADTGRFILEHIIQNTTRMSIEVSAYLNNSPLDLGQLTHVHAYLTPYIRSYDSIFRLMMDWVNFFDSSNSDHFNVLEDMQGRYRVAGNDLLELYRRIEGILGISIQNSPIAVQD